MNQTKFSLADVLTVLTALTFGFVCFLGENFITMGNTRQSIILASIVTLLLVATALGAKLLKRTSGNFKTRYIWEVALLVLFTGFMVYFTITPFSHYFIVEGKKQQIQSKLTTSITQAKNMFVEYESYAKTRENNYESNLQAVVANEFTFPSTFDSCGFVKDVSPSKQVTSKMFTLHADLFPTNYSDSAKLGVKDVATTWLSDAKNKNDRWKSIGIVSVANEVEQNSKRWLNVLAGISDVREKCEDSRTLSFQYTLLNRDVKDHFTTPGTPTPLAIGLAFLAYLLMLLSYLITKRSTKSNLGLKKHQGDFDVEY